MNDLACRSLDPSVAHMLSASLLSILDTILEHARNATTSLLPVPEEALTQHARRLVEGLQDQNTRLAALHTLPE